MCTIGTSKRRYIKNHPRDEIAKQLRGNDWPDKAIIIVSTGVQSPCKFSKLGKMLGHSQGDGKYLLSGNRRFVYALTTIFGHIEECP